MGHLLYVAGAYTEWNEMQRNPRVHGLSSLQLKRALFQAAVDTLQSQGWSVERSTKKGASSIRTIKREVDGERQSGFVTIRTSQNGSIAFTRDAADTGWKTLREVSKVIVSCVDDPRKPVCAIVQVYDAEIIQAGFNKAYAQKKKAGTASRPGTGFWLPVSQFDLQRKSSTMPYLPIIERNEAFIDLKRYMLLESNHAVGLSKDREKYFLTIPDARRRLALTLGVHESEIKISINSAKTRRDNKGS